MCIRDSLGADGVVRLEAELALGLHEVDDIVAAAFDGCLLYTSRQLADSGSCACYNGFGQTGPRKDQYHHGHLRRVHPFQRCEMCIRDRSSPSLTASGN